MVILFYYYIFSLGASFLLQKKGGVFNLSTSPPPPTQVLVFERLGHSESKWRGLGLRGRFPRKLHPNLSFGLVSKSYALSFPCHL